MGTLYDDELSGKAAAGDKWAEGVLKSRFLPILAWQETFVLRHAPRILVQSPYTLRRIAEKFPEIHKQLDLVMVPVDTDIFMPLSEESKSARRYVLNISRINDPRKNIPLLLDAFSLVASIEADLYLILAGDDPEQSLIDHCNQLGIRDRVIFRGKVNKDDLIHLYQNAELMVISSAQEGLGIAMLEAISCGTPVVATDCGGPEGIVSEDITGCIVTNYDADKLARAITELLQNPAKLKHLRASCREFALQNWSKTVIEQKLRFHFISVFPDSIATYHHLENENVYSKAFVKPNQVQKNNRPQEILAFFWCVLIVAAYIQHQTILHWNAIQSSILDPLRNILQ
jgi:glycosyltransferase involved in cell wall biosynthesis